MVMKAAPNPFRESTAVQYELRTAARVTISVYDAQGKVLQVLVDENKKAGSYTESFNASRLGSGTYFIKIAQDGLVKQTLPIVKG